MAKKLGLDIKKAWFLLYFNFKVKL
jgi:hypothetical protein